MNVTDVYFNDVPINSVMDVRIVDLNNYPEYEIRRYKVARADRSITASKEAVKKEITVNGRICGSNRGDIEAKLAILKLMVYGIRGQLKVLQAGSEVIYTATCDAIAQRWNSSVLEVDLTFTAGDPFGRIQPSQTISLPNITSASQSFTLAAGSTIPIRPQITLNFTDATDGTDKTVSLLNSDTNIGISITNDFADGDVLYIDSEQLIVTLNGQPVDFSGSFPVFTVTVASIFNPSVNITYTDDFTDRDVNGTFAYSSRV